MELCTKNQLCCPWCSKYCLAHKQARDRIFAALFFNSKLGWLVQQNLMQKIYQQLAAKCGDFCMFVMTYAIKQVQNSSIYKFKEFLDEYEYISSVLQLQNQHGLYLRRLRQFDTELNANVVQALVTCGFIQNNKNKLFKNLEIFQKIEKYSDISIQDRNKLLNNYNYSINTLQLLKIHKNIHIYFKRGVKQMLKAVTQYEEDKIEKRYHKKNLPKYFSKQSDVKSSIMTSLHIFYGVLAQYLKNQHRASQKILTQSYCFKKGNQSEIFNQNTVLILQKGVNIKQNKPLDIFYTQYKQKLKNILIKQNKLKRVQDSYLFRNSSLKILILVVFQLYYNDTIFNYIRMYITEQLKLFMQSLIQNYQQYKEVIEEEYQRIINYFILRQKQQDKIVIKIGEIINKFHEDQTTNRIATHTNQSLNFLYKILSLYK